MLSTNYSLTQHGWDSITFVVAFGGIGQRSVPLQAVSPFIIRKNVVLLDFPRSGIKSIGLVTSPLIGSNGEPSAAVYVPTTPNPTSGYLVIVPEKDLIRTDITVDEAMRIIISGGIMSSEALTNYTGAVSAPEDKGTSNH